MKLTNQHKALLITLFLSGSIVLLVFNLSLRKYNPFLSESYYEIEPEEKLTEEEIKILETLEKLNNVKAETNNAFNETEKNNTHFTQAYKTIAPPEDYTPKINADLDEPNMFKSNYETEPSSKLEEDELLKFDKINKLLKKQQTSENNSKSTISFSLKNRQKVHIPVPVYLCEVNGKVVINITVNAQGSVINAYVNTASSSNNACLIEHALEYAKQSQFSIDALKKEQIGTITFNFLGKD